MKTKQLTTVLALLIISYSTFSQPYPYRNCSVVTIVIQTTQETIDRLVPKPFTANNEGIMIFDMSELNIEGYFKYNELIIYIPVELYGKKGYYVPTLYVDHFNALIRGRELWGFNKILANINIQKTSTEISYKVKVFNQDLLDLKYNVGKQIQIPESPTCLFFNFKRIPSIEDGSFEINQITSVPLTNFHYLTYQKGTAQVTLNDIKEGGLGLIPILKIMDASFSTRDFDLGYGKIEIDYNFKK